MKAGFIASLAGALFLAASCATPYGETGYSGGYESNWLAPDVLSVDVSGNGFTSDQRVKDYALLQAAERGQQAGYKYFTMLRNDNQGGVDTYYTPPTATTTTTANAYGNSLYATSNTTTTGGVQQVYKPGRAMVVRMHREVPEGYLPGQYFAIDEILSTIGVKYLPKK